ncbi:MAG: hypothetical protein HY959_04235 [Ignavibacteriae bacterium]|nr:hypothetical protein [Ignavibacteriota bacterium]
MIIENPTYSIEELNILEKKVINNLAEIKDYEKIDSILNSMGFNNIIKDKMREFNINSYSEYLLERRIKKMDIAAITGTILGVIAALKKILTNKI